MESQVEQQNESVILVSFGYSNGKGFKFLESSQQVTIFNCRHLSNPCKSLRDRFTGENKDLRSDFFSNESATHYFNECKENILKKLKDTDSNEQHVFAFGCEKGKHRSVSMAVRMAEELNLEISKDSSTLQHYEVCLVHRDLQTGDGESSRPKQKQRERTDARKKASFRRGGFDQFE